MKTGLKLIKVESKTILSRLSFSIGVFTKVGLKIIHIIIHFGMTEAKNHTTFKT